MDAMPTGPEDFEPGKLVATRSDALLVVGGTLGFLLGALIAFGGSAITHGVGPAVVGAPIGMASVMVLNVLTRRVSRRVRPDHIGSFARWSFESRLGQQWMRPSVL